MTAAEVWFLRAEAALRGFTSEKRERLLRERYYGFLSAMGSECRRLSHKCATPSDYVDAFEAKYDVKALLK